MTRKIGFACLSVNTLKTLFAGWRRGAFSFGVLGIFCAAVALPQTPQAPASDSKNAGTLQNNQQQPPEENLPPEEDESVKPRTYAFDPLEAERNIRVGNFYMHQGKTNGYRAAAGRFEDATKYNPNNAEAFFKLGEAEAKLKNKQRARAAFIKVVQMAPDSKLGKEAKKKLASN